MSLRHFTWLSQHIKAVISDTLADDLVFILDNEVSLLKITTLGTEQPSLSDLVRAKLAGHLVILDRGLGPKPLQHIFVAGDIAFKYVELGLSLLLNLVLSSTVVLPWTVLKLDNSELSLVFN
jgi:hypothetical protein